MHRVHQILCAALGEIPRTDDVLEDEDDWYYTPTRSYADMTGLDQLPPVALNIDAHFDSDQGHATFH